MEYIAYLKNIKYKAHLKNIKYIAHLKNMKYEAHLQNIKYTHILSILFCFFAPILIRGQGLQLCLRTAEWRW